MKGLLICLPTILFLASCASQQVTSKGSPEATIAFSRYFSVTTCFRGEKKCIEPVVKNLESSNVQKSFEQFGKGPERGVSAFESYRIEENGIPFNSEIRITKKESSEVYHVYLMLRSGRTNSRKGVVKTFEIKDISSFDNVTITDTPIKFEGGELKADLTFGLPLDLSN